MKGLVFDIKHCAIHDGPGLRTTVFLKGCPLNCWWCHNPESIDPSPQNVIIEKKIGNQIFTETETIGKYLSVEEVWAEVQKDMVFFEESGGGVTFSGGEPLHQIDFLLNLLKVSKSNGVHSAVDTSGFTSRIKFDKIIPYTDLFLFDIKHLDDEKHQKYTGVSNRLILQNLESLVSHNKRVIIRFPIIRGYNDSDEFINQFIDYLSQFGKSIYEVHILPYHETAEHKYKKFGLENRMNGTRRHSKEELLNIREKFTSNDLTVKIHG